MPATVYRKTAAGRVEVFIYRGRKQAARAIESLRQMP